MKISGKSWTLSKVRGELQDREVFVRDHGARIPRRARRMAYVRYTPNTPTHTNTYAGTLGRDYVRPPLCSVLWLRCKSTTKAKGGFVLELDGGPATNWL